MSWCGQYIYHVAIIDYLQDWSVGKWTENKVKRLVASLEGLQGKDVSVQHPHFYKLRFDQFTKKTVFNNIH